MKILKIRDDKDSDIKGLYKINEQKQPELILQRDCKYILDIKTSDSLIYFSVSSKPEHKFRHDLHYIRPVNNSRLVIETDKVNFPRDVFYYNSTLSDSPGTRVTLLSKNRFNKLFKQINKNKSGFLSCYREDI